MASDTIYVYDGSKQSNRYTANVSGLGGTARVAMSDVVFKKHADVAEVRGVVGHEMGHYAHLHVLWLTAVFSLMAAIGFFLVDRLFRRRPDCWALPAYSASRIRPACPCSVLCWPRSLCSPPRS